ncbi:hypothetical protein ebA394 [Aromatoleum aromaticum EbN1]|uniref:Uncharacterized protein n=1 Tax=Aromatoleum aromaticum (strain DSM 19018 / LMG 30748 / EbN1) TaxID=76114 RepID=Q5P8N3_AROAE|nr:hypothetical protein ebA394 [Aromatoleum aromaticum EbN1]
MQAPVSGQSRCKVWRARPRGAFVKSRKIFRLYACVDRAKMIVTETAPKGGSPAAVRSNGLPAQSERAPSP